MRDNDKARKAILIRNLVIVAIVAVADAALVWRWQAGTLGQKTKAAFAATYVGQERCAACHAEQVQAWRTSHHAQAMQVASDSSVLGNFNNANFAKDGVTSRFFKREASSMFIPTQGYEFPYTFGVSPLQQYLVPFPHGRLQSFVVAWDSRCKQHGGQRWFDLYPDQRITPADPPHWTGHNQTWNHMCADCRSPASI